MKKFLKENIVLVLGVSLPFLLVVFFLLATTLPKFFIANPKHDFLFYDNSYSPLAFQVINKKLHLLYSPSINAIDMPKPHLYRYFASTGKTEEINFTIPSSIVEKHANKTENVTTPNVNTNIVVSVDPKNLPSTEQAKDTSKIVSEIKGNTDTVIPISAPITEVANIDIDNSEFAPDGYKFIGRNSGYYGYGGPFSLLGFSRSYRENVAVITNSGKNVSIEYPTPGNNYYRSPNFIGWIIK